MRYNYFNKEQSGKSDKKYPFRSDAVCYYNSYCSKTAITTFSPPKFVTTFFTFAFYAQTFLVAQG